MKLRLWIHDWGGGRMEYEGFGVNEKGEVLFLDEGVYHIGRVNNQTKIVMRSTGLHDKNGKEIYEGDVIDGLSGINIDAGRQIIEFRDGFFGVNGMTLSEGASEYNWTVDNIEIIGNIYQNPDLIK